MVQSLSVALPVGELNAGTEYTGTGALKTAFTRTGQWTVSGALLDGMTSAKRYVNQTVYDDEKVRA